MSFPKMQTISTPLIDVEKNVNGQTDLPSALRFDKPPAEAALFFPEHSFNSRSEDLLVRGPMGVVLLNIITLLVDVAL